jgi:hypothetical protein
MLAGMGQASPVRSSRNVSRAHRLLHGRCSVRAIAGSRALPAVEFGARPQSRNPPNNCNYLVIDRAQLSMSP